MPATSPLLDQEHSNHQRIRCWTEARRENTGCGNSVGRGGAHYRKATVGVPRAQLVHRKLKSERKRERQKLGRLQELVVQKGTRTRYLTAVSRFLEFLQMQNYSYPCSFTKLDSKVCEFIEILWQEGEPKAYASDTISGLGHFIPACK